MFNFIFILSFVLFLVVFIVILFKSISEWNHNNHSPLLSVDASVQSKRTSLTTHQHPNGGDASGAQGFYSSTTTTYFVTFQVESGDRMEFCVDGNAYAFLSEGDNGKLSFQGTRYIGFEPHK